MTTFNALMALYLAALPLMGSPGPATLSLAATASVYGVLRSLWYLLGIILGTSTVLLMVATGVTGLLFAIPGVLPVLVAAAMAYILYLAYKIATAPVLSGDVETADAPSLFGGVLLAIANPKAFAAIGAVFSSITVFPGEPFQDAAVKSAALASVIIVANSLWVLLGAGLSRYLRHPRTGRIINIAFAVLLVLSVVMAVAL